MAQSILYYPSINIEDGPWLRNSLLYWDNVCSIVPFESYEEYSPEVQYLIDRNVYRAIYPTDLFQHADYAEEFSDVIRSRIEPQFSVRGKNVNTDTNRTTIHRNKIYSPQLSDIIHYRKIPVDLFVMLTEQGYIKNLDDRGWLEMDKRVASIYMRTLAEFTAKYSDQDMVISTDTPSKIRDIYQNLPKRSNSFCLSLILERCLPQPSMEIGIEKLLDFKEHRKDELLEFRTKLRTFENNLSHSESPEEIKAEIEAFREEWGLELSKIDKLFRGDRISYSLENAKTLIGTTGAAGLLAGIQQYAGTVPNWLFGAGLGLSALIGVGVNYVNYKQKINAQRTDSGFAYITSAYQQGIIRRSPFFEMID